MRLSLFVVTALALFMTTACGQAPAPADELPASEAAASEPAEQTDTLAYDYGIDYLTGHFNPAEHPDFVAVEKQYTDGDPYHLHQDTYAAFQRMHAAALEDGVKLIIISATRNFDRQKSIWEAKWRGDRLLEGREKAPEAYPDPAERALAILRYSSMPGTSRHHWGTDIDLNNLTNEFFDAGEGKAIYDWLTAHAAEYGFCQPYSPKGADRPDGYNEERWHWSYLPLAKPLTDLARKELQNSDIAGFEGAETAASINVVQKYVLGINPACQ
jgi:LAS superfamily LD-carboxypeptidase LdcB